MKNLRNIFFRHFAFWLFSIFILNSLANFFFWYSSIKEFDMLMHFIGGITAALFIFWVFYKKYTLWLEEGNKWKSFRVTFLAVLAIALLWEVFEFSLIGFFKLKTSLDIPDTISDVVMGSLGSIFGFLYILKKYKKERNKNGFII